MRSSRTFGRIAATAAASLAILVPARAGNVRVVDASGGGDFLQIQAAVDAAFQGDTILVRSGTYAPFNVVNKAVSVIADTGATVMVNGTVQVRNLAADRDVLLSGMQVTGAVGGLAYQGAGLYLKNDLGSVRVQDCGLQAVAAHAGAMVEGSTDVSLSSCQAYGGAGLTGDAWPECEGGAGVSAAGSNVALYYSDLLGGTATTGSFGGCQGCPGGSGFSSTTSSFLHAASTLFTGVDGADALDGCAGYNFLCNGGNGGHGANLRVWGFDSEPQTFWSFWDAFATGTGGDGGHGMCGCGLVVDCWGDWGENGVNIYSNSFDTVQQTGQLAPLLGVSQNPAREQTSIQLSFLGDPNSVVLLAAGSETSFHQRPGQGVQLVASGWPHRYRIVGKTDPMGRIHDVWPVPELGPGVESRVVYLQPIYVDPGGNWTWGSPVGVVLLDQAF